LSKEAWNNTKHNWNANYSEESQSDSDAVLLSLGVAFFFNAVARFVRIGRVANVSDVADSCWCWASFQESIDHESDDSSHFTIFVVV